MSEPQMSVDLRKFIQQLYPGDRYFDLSGVARVINKMPNFAVLTEKWVFSEVFDPKQLYVVDLTSVREEPTYTVKKSAWFSKTVEMEHDDFYTRYQRFADQSARRYAVEIRYNPEVEGSRVRYNPFVYSFWVKSDLGKFKDEFLEASGFATPIEKTLDRRTVYFPGPIWFRNVSAEAAQATPPIGYKLEMAGAILFEDEVELLIDRNTPVP